MEDDPGSLLDACADALVLFDREGNILAMNLAAREAFLADSGTAASQGRKVLELLADGEKSRPRIEIRAKAALAGDSSFFPCACRGADGEPFPAEIALKPIGAGKSLRILATIRDRSDTMGIEAEKERFQFRIHQDQKMEAVSRLAGGFAHRMNDAFTAVLGNLALLDELMPGYGEDPGQAEAVLRQAMTECHRGGALSRQILSLGPGEAPPLRPLDLKAEIGRWMEAGKTSLPADVRLELELPPGPAWFMGDQASFGQAILNAILNSQEALAGNPIGKARVIRVKVERISPDVREPGAFPDPDSIDDFWKVDISDTGIGMDAESLRRCFEPFFSAGAKRGLSIGLSQVYACVRSFGGFLEIRSEPGHGTDLSLFFPLLRKETAASETETPQTGSGVILVVDDDDTVRLSAAALLRECGYAVFEAASGKKGLEVFSQQGKAVSAVLLDMSMPEMDGLETMERILAVDPQARIMLMSGFVEQSILDRAMRLGAKDFIAKPFTLLELSGKVKALVDA